MITISIGTFPVLESHQYAVSCIDSASSLCQINNYNVHWMDRYEKPIHETIKKTSLDNKTNKANTKTSNKSKPECFGTSCPLTSIGWPRGWMNRRTRGPGSKHNAVWQHRAQPPAAPGCHGDAVPSGTSGWSWSVPWSTAQGLVGGGRWWWGT